MNNLKVERTRHVGLLRYLEAGIVTQTGVLRSWVELVEAVGYETELTVALKRTITAHQEIGALLRQRLAEMNP